MNKFIKDKFRNVSAISFKAYNNELIINFSGFEEEEDINVLVLAANTNENAKNPGPIINALISREISTLRIPIMIVPGNFSKDHISQIT